MNLGSQPLCGTYNCYHLQMNKLSALKMTFSYYSPSSSLNFHCALKKLVIHCPRIHMKMIYIPIHVRD